LLSDSVKQAHTYTIDVSDTRRQAETDTDGAESLECQVDHTQSLPWLAVTVAYKQASSQLAGS